MSIQTPTPTDLLQSIVKYSEPKKQVCIKITNIDNYNNLTYRSIIINFKFEVNFNDLDCVLRDFFDIKIEGNLKRDEVKNYNIGNMKNFIKNYICNYFESHNIFDSIKIKNPDIIKFKASDKDIFRLNDWDI